jgi:hypothetical protein
MNQVGGIPERRSGLPRPLSDQKIPAFSGTPESKLATQAEKRQQIPHGTHVRKSAPQFEVRQPVSLLEIRWFP